MIPRLLAALMLLIAVPAAAKTPNEKALSEADAFLVSCADGDPGDIAVCQSNRVEFVDSYIRAKAGNRVAMITISRVLLRSPPVPGIRRDSPYGCAWLSVAVSLDPDDVRRAYLAGLHKGSCADQLPEVTRILTNALIAEIVAAPATEPASTPPRGPLPKLP